MYFYCNSVAHYCPLADAGVALSDPDISAAWCQPVEVHDSREQFWVSGSYRLALGSYICWYHTLSQVHLLFCNYYAGYKLLCYCFFINKHTQPFNRIPHSCPFCLLCTIDDQPGSLGGACGNLFAAYHVFVLLMGISPTLSTMFKLVIN